MYHTEKGSKAKTLATASTLQKVVCPAPERDPQEILSNGWRKVGEQKRVTNRLANGQDAGYVVPSRDGSFSDANNQASRPNGRQVLDKMFGHLRPHHNIMPTAVLKSEDQELENGLGTQAARAAYFRPAIGPALNTLPADAPTVESSVAAGGPLLRTGSLARHAVGAGYTCGLEPGELESRTGGFGLEDDHPDSDRPSPSSAPSGCGVGVSPRSSPRAARYRRAAAAGASGASVGGLTSPSPPPRRNGSLTRRGSSGGDSSGRRRAGLPAVARSCPSDHGGLAGGGGGGGGSSHSAELSRLPAAAGAAAAAAVQSNRRASISGDLGLPVITGAGGGGGGGAGAKVPAVRTRRMSLTNGVEGAGGVAAVAVLPSSIGGGSNGGGGGAHRTSGSNIAINIGSGGGLMPLLIHKATAIAVTGGVPYSTSSDGTGARWSPRAHAVAGGHLIVDTASAAGPGRGPAAVATAAASGSGGGGGGGLGSPLSRPNNTMFAETSTLAHVGLLAQLGDPHNAPGGGGGTAAAAVNTAVPLSGLDNLAATGLGDAITQLRNIRMGNGSSSGTNGGSGQGKDARERRPEPGLAGLTPLAVPRPPLDNWQMGGKKEPDLDPCKGIRLVDTANYVLPRAMADGCLQAKMAQHQAAMRELVRAEGAPMSESEMEAVKLLGRLERSGARHRNLSDLADEEPTIEDFD